MRGLWRVWELNAIKMSRLSTRQEFRAIIVFGETIFIKLEAEVSFDRPTNVCYRCIALYAINDPVRCFKPYVNFAVTQA